MNDLHTILIVDDDEAIADLFERIIGVGLPHTRVLLARDGSAAIGLVATEQVDLVLLDINLSGSIGGLPDALSGREVCLKLRAMRPQMPILPCTVEIGAASFLADLGCAPTVSKQQISLNPPSLVNHIVAAWQHPPEMRVPAAAFQYMLEHADQMLAGELRQRQTGVLIVSQHPLLRSGLEHLLRALSVPVIAVLTSSNELSRHGEELSEAYVVLGPVADLDLLNKVGTHLRSPVLAVALQHQELEKLTLTQLGTASMLLYDEQGDAAQLLQALQAVRAGQRCIIVPPAVLARWVPRMEGLSQREWEIVIATLLLPSQAAVAASSGITTDSVETYWKRTRRRLAPKGLTTILQLARDQLVRHLGIVPSVPPPPR